MKDGQKNKDKKILTIIVLLVLALVMIQTVNNVLKTFQIDDEKSIVEQSDITKLSAPRGIGAASYGRDIGRASMCLNSIPIITYDCNLTNATLNLGSTYNCTFEAIDPNGDEVIFKPVWLNSPALFNMTPDGGVNFTLTRAHMAYQNNFLVYAYDDSPCSNNYTYEEFYVTVIGENRAPYLIRNFSDEKIIQDYYINFYMTDYFIEPDEDVMSYFYVLESGNTVSARFFGNRAQIRGVNCGISSIYFVAVDPLGLTASSNTVQYEVTCPNKSIQSTGDSASKGEGGRGAGGDTNVCTSDWKCSIWSPCRPDNRSFRRCIDFNACDGSNYIQYFTKNCTYSEEKVKCIEKWECGEWSTCEDGLHTRVCLDKRNCGTANDKPAETENCSKISTCFNGIQDPDETGIDCGGLCGICKNVEEPSKESPLITIIITAALTIGTTGALCFIFRKKIIAMYKKMFGKKPKLKRKIFINNKQKEKLLQLLNIMQARLDEGKINHSIDESSLLIREYFKQLLSIDNLSSIELLSKIVNLKDKDLEKILVMFYAKATSIVHLRNRGTEIKTEEIQELIDEISHNIYLIAEFGDQDAINSVKDRTTINKGNLEQIFNKLSNIYIALKFGELIVAKDVYKEIVKLYEVLPTKEKSIPYTDIIRAFHAVHYLEKQYKEI
jgi:hypothetical protein